MTRPVFLLLAALLAVGAANCWRVRRTEPEPPILVVRVVPPLVTRDTPSLRALRASVGVTPRPATWRT